jgi:hypothetical protein
MIRTFYTLANLTPAAYAVNTWIKPPYSYSNYMSNDELLREVRGCRYGIFRATAIRVR